MFGPAKFFGNSSIIGGGRPSIPENLSTVGAINGREATLSLVISEELGYRITPTFRQESGNGRWRNFE